MNDSWRERGGMRILLLIPLSPLVEETNLGPLYVAAAARRAGHQVTVHYHDPRRLLPSGPLRYRWLLADAERVFRAVQPEVVAFTAVSTHAAMVVATARHLRSRCGVRTIIGGPHAMIARDELMAGGAFDAVCWGEGERALPRYLTAVAAGEETPVPGVTYRTAGGTVITGPAEAALPALDDYPEPDREPLLPGYRAGRMRAANVITGRGCPFRCAYCLAPSSFAGGGQVRFRSAAAVVAELERFRQAAGRLDEVIFSDETLTLNHDHLRAVLELYQRRVGLPFVCQTRPETVTRQIARELAAAGCRAVTIGIESGSPRIREVHLNRKMSDEQIVAAAAVLHEAGLSVGSFNMIGLPEETEATIRAAVELNRRAGIDHPVCTVFMPFRGTPLHDYYRERDWIKSEPEISYYDTVSIRHPNLNDRQLLFYANNFAAFVRDGWHAYPFLPLQLRQWRQQRVRGLVLALKQVKLLLGDLTGRG